MTTSRKKVRHTLHFSQHSDTIFFFIVLILFQTLTRPLACKISLDHKPYDGEDATFQFLQKQLPFAETRHDLSDSLPYGRVFVTSSGFHGEFFTHDNMILSLIFLGGDEVSALRMMQKITQQHMYILSLKQLY